MEQQTISIAKAGMTTMHLAFSAHSGVLKDEFFLNSNATPVLFVGSCSYSLQRTRLKAQHSLQAGDLLSPCLPSNKHVSILQLMGGGMAFNKTYRNANQGRIFFTLSVCWLLPIRALGPTTTFQTRRIRPATLGFQRECMTTQQSRVFSEKFV